MITVLVWRVELSGHCYIIRSRGWTCMNCRSGCEDHKSKVNELQCKLSQVGEHLSDVLLKDDALERKLSLLEGKDVGEYINSFRSYLNRQCL